MPPPERSARPRLLIVTQTYRPDPASAGQHTADVAEEMAARGYDVVVFTARRGYEDPRTKYPARETMDGVRVFRLPFSSLGKGSLGVRLVAQLALVLQSIVRGVFLSNVRGVLISTSPPVAAIAGLGISWLRRLDFVFWVMDINPDQAVALGRVGARSLPARCLHWLNATAMRRARVVITLDRYMAKRLRTKAVVDDTLEIVPPWPHEDRLRVASPSETAAFRREHDLADKLVVMYSGNHGPCQPLTTILDAARRMRDVDEVAFVFVGGGIHWREIGEMALPNTHVLPYQPFERLGRSLAAADLHVVSVADATVGIVHSSKVYGAMAVSRLILLLGPEECHVSQILQQEAVGWRFDHGDVDGVERCLRNLAGGDRTELVEMGSAARRLVERSYRQATLRDRVCDAIEAGLRPSLASEQTRAAG